MSDDIGFAPQDPDDGREIGEWQSRYCKEAKREILFESVVLVLFLVFAVILMICNFLSIHTHYFPQYSDKFGVISPVINGALAGLVGGTLFSLKWLYHTVAKFIWHLDRRLWRFLTPVISSALSAFTIIFIKSGIFVPFNAQSIDSSLMCLSVGFFVGYFSDSALAKFAEIANTLFGGQK